MGPAKGIRIELKYFEGQPAVKHVARVSKPGRRVYSGSKELPRVQNGLGITIVSTPRGVLSDAEARDPNVGGEVLEIGRAACRERGGKDGEIAGVAGPLKKKKKK